MKIFSSIFFILCLFSINMQSCDKKKNLLKHKRQLEQAILHDESEKIEKLIEKNGKLVINPHDIEYIIFQQHFKTLKALATLVNNNSKFLRQVKFKQNLNYGSRHDDTTLLMLAADAKTTEPLQILLTIPCIRETINFQNQKFCTALSEALYSSSDHVALLLDHGAQVPANKDICGYYRQIFKEAQKKFEEKRNVRIYNAYLQKKDSSKKLPVELLGIIYSFLM